MNKYSKLKEEKILERRRKHLEQIFKPTITTPTVADCLHNMCSECHGTFIKLNGTQCVHMINCKCSRCTSR